MEGAILAGDVAGCERAAREKAVVDRLYVAVGDDTACARPEGAIAAGRRVAALAP
jgi:hypothetical protein